MQTVGQFPHAVREIENCWITLSDGCRVAARIWLPEGAENAPVPAILEYLPYRKRDGTSVRDALTHPYFAGHGYAAIRVDMRGNAEIEEHKHNINIPLGKSLALGYCYTVTVIQIDFFEI